MRVLIADDHALVREGLRSLLETRTGIEVVGEATTGEEAVALAKEARPDVVLMDITMPGMNGLEATRLIRQHSPAVRILVLTMHEGDEYFFKILEAGASGYFLKGASSRELISALEAVWRGHVFLHPTMAKKLLGDYLQRARPGQVKENGDGLTSREREILKSIAEGRTNQEIAHRLIISPSTVQTHRANVMAKLGLHSRTDLVKYAISHELIALSR